MKQAVMPAPGKIEFNQIDRPKPQAHEVLMQTRRIGVCGSDITFFMGCIPFDEYPAAYHAIEKSNGKYMIVMIELGIEKPLVHILIGVWLY